MIKLINKKENILCDNIGYVENWNFSKANMSNENRIHAITLVASICYQSPKALGSESLYNRLMSEAGGLPSSSFEFVPILISIPFLEMKLKCEWNNFKLVLKRGFEVKASDMNIFKYGEKVENGNYLLTNFRAVVYDFENFGIDLRDSFNSEKECEIIEKHFKVFKYYVDLPTRAQMVRHRINWQELSRRYVSGKRVQFEFYTSEKMKFNSIHGDICLTDEAFNTICVERYNQALDRGVKPEEARRCIPQSMYTTIWGAFQPSQLENYFKLRSDSHAQKEIRATSDSMKELLGV